MSASSWGLCRSPSLCINLFFKSFLRPLLTCAAPEWFPFLSVANITKLERLHRAARRAISSCLSFSSILLLLSEAFLPPLRVTLLILFCHLMSGPFVSNLLHFRFGQTWSETKTLQIFLGELLRPLTHSSFLLLLLGSISACPSSSWNLPLFPVKSTLSSPCSCSDPPLTRHSAAFAHFDSPPHDLVIWQTALFLFLLAKVALAYLPTALVVALRPLFFFLAGPVCSSVPAEACAILHALCRFRQHQQACHFSLN